ncbi:MAG: hypothetical protein AAFX03_08180 [Pseudomonadota bacterium]
MNASNVMEQAVTWAEANLLASRELAAFGAIVLLVLAVFAIAMIAGQALSLVRRMRAIAKDSALSRSDNPGYKVLLAAPSGLRPGATFEFTHSALEDYLPGFCFGAPLNVGAAGGAVGGKKDLMRRLGRSGADIIIKADRRDKSEEGLVLSGLVRAATGSKPFSFALSGDHKAWAKGLAPVLAFMTAKSMQPAIAQPTNFRAEKAAPVAAQLKEILDSGVALTPQARAEIEDDFAAFTLHVAEQGVSLDGLDEVISMRRATLGRPDATTGARLSARMDLGRALVLRAEQNFDQAVVAEAMNHLREAIEMMRADPALRKAEIASSTIQKAQSLLASRKRFAVTGSL